MATITDVAMAAGVAPSTVSYVLSGKRSISAETRHRVEKSIRELGYRPSVAARSSAGMRLLAVVATLRPERKSPLPLEFLTAAVETARAYRHDLLLLTTEPGPAGIRRMAAPPSPVDAVVVLDVQRADARVPVLRSLRKPVVLVGVPDQHYGLTCLGLDLAAAAAESVGHLADLGHRHVALIGPPPSVWRHGDEFGGRLLAGFTAAVAKRDLRAVVRLCGPSRQGSRECLDNVFGQQPGTTALVVHNEAALPSVLAELEHRRLRVPEDVSVVAICPEHIAASQPIPLTFVAVPAAELGRTAVELAMGRITDAGQQEVRLLSPYLTERASSSRRGPR